MVRRAPPLGAVPLALMLGQAALPLAASAQQASGRGRRIRRRRRQLRDGETSNGA